MTTTRSTTSKIPTSHQTISNRNSRCARPGALHTTKPLYTDRSSVRTEEISGGWRGGLEMHDYVLNARVARNQRGFHSMTYSVAFADRDGRINLNVQFDEEADAAFSNKTFLDPLDARLVCRSGAY